MTDSVSTQIDLAAGRTIVIRQKGHAYTFNLRRAEERDWFAYFDGVVTTAEQRGREVMRETDGSAAGLALVTALLVDVSGYVLPAGVASVAEVPNWQSKIPMPHRLACSEILLDVRAAEMDEELALGGEAVAIETLWSADAEGRMPKYRCVHRFESPSAEHCRAYMRKVSSSRVVGGSRGGKTIYTGAQRVLCQIYDELIQSVEGYAWNGEEIGENAAREKLATMMDARHKVAAAAQLFSIPEMEE